jgi:hypothetical protein
MSHWVLLGIAIVAEVIGWMIFGQALDVPSASA